MSWEATAHVKKLKAGSTGEPLTPSEKLAAMVLADYHNRDAGYAYPTVPVLAADCLVQPRAMQKTLRSLEAKGVIVTEPVAGSRSRYRFVGFDVDAPQLATEPCAAPADAVTEADPDASVAQVDAPSAAHLNVAAIRAVLDEAIEANLAAKVVNDRGVEEPITRASAYNRSLDDVAGLADAFDDVSGNVAGALRNHVIYRAALHARPDFPKQKLSQLYKAGDPATRGPFADKALVGALFATEDATPDDLMRYLLGTAKRMRLEAIAAGEAA